jgi:exo-1,4-beta-D-glucosaminidase
MRSPIWSLLLLLSFPHGAQSVTANAGVRSVELTSGWALVSADSVNDAGSAISTPGYDASHWYPVTLPSTVMAGLVANGVFADAFADTNLRGVPDLTRQDWWYRGEFAAPASGAGQQYWLRFKGIAYAAQIWLNGVLLDSCAIGTLVNHEYDATSLVVPGSTNVLALKITPPSSAGTSLSFWYVDWNPRPPDMNAGIWGKVLLDATGPVVLRDPYVRTVLPLPATDSADLTIYVDAANGSPVPVTGVLSGRIGKPGRPAILFRQDVTLAPHERREIAFEPGAFRQLHVKRPALWWPHGMGSPELYDLQLAFTVAGKASDVETVRFGIRQFTDRITPPIYGHTYRGYRVNGQDVLVRGADYVWDLFLRVPASTNRAHMTYARDMGLNLLRFEGTLGNEDLYDLADQSGIMLMPGYVCCTYWAQYGAWSARDRAVADASTESQMRLLRAHASSLVWTYGSDELPPDSVLAGWKRIATRLHWQNPTLDNVASYNNPGGSVPKMNGPYAWEPPIYWYADTAKGGAFGFCAEHGGESVPPEETLERFLSPANRWPIGAAYGYHAGPSPFDNLDGYSRAVSRRYGASSDITAYADRAQLLNYESARAQFEAFAAHAHALAQGTVYWMLNSAWPSVHWNLYDYYLKQGGGYFGAKKALEPIHILYDYGTRAVNVFNATLAETGLLDASVTVYNLPDLAVKCTAHVTMVFPANQSTPALSVPVPDGLTRTHLIRLQLRDATHRAISDNLYWCSTSADTLGSVSDWYHTDLAAYADMTGLNDLAPDTSVTVTASLAREGPEDVVEITLRNPSPDRLAFFLRPEVVAGTDGTEVVPITYTDNYATLFPGEAATLTARYSRADLRGRTPILRVRGYNVPPFTVPVVPGGHGVRGDR